MKNFKLFLVAVTFGFANNVQSQEEEKIQSESEFNRWSIELQAGASSVSSNLNTKKYFVNHYTFSHANIGLRYMLNPIVGLKLNAAYDGFEDGNIDGEKSLELKGKFLNANLQGVINLTGIMNTTSFSTRFGVLLHGGAGITNFMIDKPISVNTPGLLNDDNDVMINLIYGATLMYKISDKVALTADYTRRTHFYNRLRFDANFDQNVYINSFINNVTLGLNFYLGNKEKKHADWSSINNNENENEEIKELKDKIDAIEAANNNNKGVDMSAIQKMISEKAGNNTAKEQDIAKYLINNSYIASYFDYNIAEPTNASTEGVDFVLNYLRKNPNSNVKITGYADDKGTENYNDKLALRRAENVKTTLEKAGINASRITTVSGGQDKSVDADSEWAKNTVRKVLFKVQ